ncbi:MAG: peptidase S1 [Spirochaetia bacterium]
MKKLLAIFVVLLLVGTFAFAQNYSGRPTYGEHRLNSGFTPDPYTVSIRAGGGDSPSVPGIGRVGYIHEAGPDVRLQYRSGSYNLYIYAACNSDTTLLVNQPNGRWEFNDDQSGLSPGILFNNPQSGQYDIWVGTYSRDAGTPSATLYVSEIGFRR